MSGVGVVLPDRAHAGVVGQAQRIAAVAARAVRRRTFTRQTIRVACQASAMIKSVVWVASVADSLRTAACTSCNVVVAKPTSTYILIKN